MKFVLVVILCSFVLGSAQRFSSSLDRHSPQTACTFLDSFGLKTGRYKNYDSQYRPNEYWCSSPYADIGGGGPLPTNLAYYVTGDQFTIKELKLVLNVNSLHTGKRGHEELTVASDVITKRVFNEELSDAIMIALLEGRSSTWKAGKNRMEVVREDWPTGKGYSVRFIIR